MGFLGQEIAQFPDGTLIQKSDKRSLACFVLFATIAPNAVSLVARTQRRSPLNVFREVIVS